MTFHGPTPRASRAEQARRKLTAIPSMSRTMARARRALRRRRHPPRQEPRDGRATSLARRSRVALPSRRRCALRRLPGRRWRADPGNSGRGDEGQGVDFDDHNAMTLSLEFRASTYGSASSAETPSSRRPLGGAPPAPPTSLTRSRLRAGHDGAAGATTQRRQFSRDLQIAVSGAGSPHVRAPLPQRAVLGAVQSGRAPREHRT